MLHMTLFGSHADLAHHGWKEASSCHVRPNWRGRVDHMPSLYSHSAWCICERTEEEKARWGQCPGWVVNAAWLHAACTDARHVYWWPDDTSGSCFQPVVVLSLVTCSCGLLYLKRTLCSVWHSFTFRGRKQVSSITSGPSRISGVLTDVIDMSTGKA